MGNGAGELLIPAETLEKAGKGVDWKTTIPILAHLHVGENDKGEIALTSTDLEAPTVRTVPKVDAVFPDTEKVIPKAEPTVSISLSATYLKQIAAYALKHGRRGAALKLNITDPDSPVRMEFRLDDGQEATIVLMPMRY